MLRQSKYFLAILLWLVYAVAQRGPTTSAQPAPIAIFDGTFATEDWSIFRVDTIGGTTHSVQQALNGGNPGTFRSMTHTLPPAPPGVLAKVAVTHLNLAHSYDPGLQGAISHIDYAEDGIMLSLPWPDAFSTTQVALVQDNRLFLTQGFIRFVGNTTWQSDALSNLTVNNFAAADGSGDHPDFSASGSVIQFGYTRLNTRTDTQPPVPPDQDLVFEHGIDNWMVTVFPEGSPPGNMAPVAINDRAVVEVEEQGGFRFIDVLDNDSDPDGDSLSISDHTLPIYGTLLDAPFGFFYSHSGHGRAVDNFTYTITDGELTATADVLILGDCGCVVDCVSGEAALESGAPSLLDRVGSRLSHLLLRRPLARYDGMVDLPLLYRVRDKVMKPTEHGSRYVGMYYNTTPEVLKILLVDSPALRAEAVAAVALWQDNLRSLVDGDGTAIISQTQVDAVESFLANLSAAGSVDLQQTIGNELTRLGPLDSYVGMTMAEAAEQVLGDQLLYLPILSK